MANAKSWLGEAGAVLTSGHQAADDALTPFCWRKQKTLSRHCSKSCFPAQPREIMLPRAVLFWTGPSAWPPHPCTHSYVFLTALNGLRGQQWVILGLFKLFLAAAVRHHGQTGRARLWFLLS